MIEAFIYAAVFAGVYDRTDRFWLSLGWPYQVGCMLGDALKASGASHAD